MGWEMHGTISLGTSPRWEAAGFWVACMCGIPATGMMCGWHLCRLRRMCACGRLGFKTLAHCLCWEAQR
jgi:hypothetical protein